MVNGIEMGRKYVISGDDLLKICNHVDNICSHEQEIYRNLREKLYSVRNQMSVVSLIAHLGANLGDMASFVSKLKGDHGILGFVVSVAEYLPEETSCAE